MDHRFPLPENEATRLDRLRELFVLDSAPEPVFDRIAKLASDICGVPIALMSLIDSERQWFKANVGLDGVTETPRDVAFCAHAILGDDLFEVPDATNDSRFADNPLVVGSPGIRFYAGAPLVLPSGERMGTLCVIDREPRTLTESQARALTSLAEVATSALVMRHELVVRSLLVRSDYEMALRASEEFLSRTGRVAGVGGWELELETSRITWSEQTRRIHEVPDDYVPQLETALDFYAAEARAVVRQAVEQGVRDGTSWDLELPFVTASGKSIWVRTVGEVIRAGDKPLRLVGAFQDITARKHLEERLAQQAATMHSVTELIPALVAVVGSDRRYRFVNGAFERWCGITRDQIIGRPMEQVLGEVEYARSREHVERVLTGQPVSFEKDFDGAETIRHMALSYLPLWQQGGGVDGFVTVAQDVSTQREEEMRLRQMTQRDALTGLLNRSGFETYLQQHVGHDGAGLALLYIDLDRFKPVNDTHGHQVGDVVLQEFARRLQLLVRPGDGVARLGGDEFAVLLPGTRALAIAERVAEKIGAAARTPFEANGVVVEIDASIGIALGVNTEEGWQGLVARADTMVYRAKRTGRGRHATEVRTD